MNFFQFLLYPIIKFPRVVKYFFNQKSTGEMLDDMIKDDKLKRILNTNLVYYHDNTYEFSWHYYALAQYNYYNGAKYIKGGSYSLSIALAEIIQENGGKVETMCTVEKVIEENGKAKSVIYKDKSLDKFKESVSLYTVYIIFKENLKDIYKKTMPTLLLLIMIMN